jgi:hypothetical protein
MGGTSSVQDEPCDFPYQGLSGAEAITYVFDGKTSTSDGSDDIKTQPAGSVTSHSENRQRRYSTAPCSLVWFQKLQHSDLQPSPLYSNVVGDTETPLNHILTSLSQRENGADVPVTATINDSFLTTIASHENSKNLRAHIASLLLDMYGAPAPPTLDADGQGGAQRSPVFDMDSLVISFVPPDTTTLRMNFGDEWKNKPLASVMRNIGSGSTRSSSSFAASRINQYVFTGIAMELDALSTGKTTLHQLLSPHDPPAPAQSENYRDLRQDSSVKSPAWNFPVDFAALDASVNELLRTSEQTYQWQGVSDNDVTIGSTNKTSRFHNAALCAAGLFHNGLSSDGTASATPMKWSWDGKRKKLQKPGLNTNNFQTAASGIKEIRPMDMESPVPLFPGPGMNIAVSAITNDINNFPAHAKEGTGVSLQSVRYHGMLTSNIDATTPLRTLIDCPRDYSWNAFPGDQSRTASKVFVYARLPRRAHFAQSTAKTSGESRPRAGFVRGTSMTLFRKHTSSDTGGGGGHLRADPQPNQGAQFDREQFTLSMAGALDDGCVSDMNALHQQLQSHKLSQPQVDEYMRLMVEFTFRPMPLVGTNLSTRVNAASMLPASPQSPINVLQQWLAKKPGSAKNGFPDPNPCHPQQNFATIPMIAADPVCDCQVTTQAPGSINYDLRETYREITTNRNVANPCILSSCNVSGGDLQSTSRFLSPNPGKCAIDMTVCQNIQNVYGNKAGIMRVDQRNITTHCGPSPKSLATFVAQQVHRPRDAEPVRVGVTEISMAITCALISGAIAYALVRRIRRPVQHRLRNKVRRPK